MSRPLLPPGCYDALPPFSGQETAIVASLLRVFERFGYEQVTPSILEYTDTLLSGRGAALAPQTCRLMDPAAQKVMGLRSDHTLQIARIASTRLADAPRPLRLCYAGTIVRMQGGGLHGDRELCQAGIEMIGAASPEADAEVIWVAAEALREAGIADITIDLNLPGIIGLLLAQETLEEDALRQLRAAVAHKDISALTGSSIVYRDTLVGLMRSAGHATEALHAMRALEMPVEARRACEELAAVADILQRPGNRGWNITVDATEHRGVAYHCGISFSIFARGAPCEIGRGGRYRIETGPRVEEATGFTLYVESLREIMPPPGRGRRVLVAGGLADEQAARLREQGYVTVHALEEYGTSLQEAQRLGCTFLLRNGALEELDIKIMGNR